MFPTRLRGLPVALLLALTAPIAADPAAAAPLSETALAAQRQSYLDAERALAAGDRTRMRTLSPQLRDYPLYPYLRARELGQNLATASSAEIRQFLSQWADVPAAARLRGAWLRALAEQSRWDDVIADYRPGPDPELDCLYRTALLNRDRPDVALNNFQALWLREQPLPAACDRPVQAWASQSGLTPALAWQRFAALMGARNPAAARPVQTWLEPADQAWARLWLQVDQNPALILQAPDLQMAGSDRGAGIVTWGLARWIERNSAEAAPAFDEIRRRGLIADEQLLPLERRLAVLLAARRHPDALRRLDALGSSREDDSIREWRARLGLAQGDWPLVLRSIEHMPAAQAAQAGWRYWRARALESSGQNGTAERLYRELAGERDYYGLLAARRIGTPPTWTQRPLPRPPVATLRGLAARPAVQRARELFLLGRPGEARSEWEPVLRNADTATWRAAALLAADWNWYGQAIIWLARAGDWDDLVLRFPTPWRSEFENAAQDTQLPPAWLYAVARVESTLLPEARSGAGALGLMQLLPDTARGVASSIGYRLGDNSQLFDPAVNIRLGSVYLRQLLDRFGGNPVLATAAYNAGLRRVGEWLPAGTELAADVWIDTIPYSETRAYVRRVWEYMAIYESRLGGTAHGFEVERIEARAP